MKLIDMSVKSKLFAILGLLSAILCTVGLLGFLGTRSGNEHLDMMFNSRLIPASWVDDVTTMERKGIEAIELATIKQDADSVSTASEAVKGNTDKIKDTLTKLQHANASEAERKLIDEFDTLSNTVLDDPKRCDVR